MKLPQCSTQVWKRGGEVRDVEAWAELKIVNAAAFTIHRKESLASLAFSTSHPRREKEKGGEKRPF